MSNEVNAEAGAYIEEHPAMWTAFVSVFDMYGSQIDPLAAHLGDRSGAIEILAGSMLSRLADEHGVYLSRAVHDAQTADLLAALDERNVQSRGDLARADALARPGEAVEAMSNTRFARCICGHFATDHSRAGCAESPECNCVTPDYLFRGVGAFIDDMPGYDRDLLASKVQWEGGVLATLEYGVTASDIGDLDLARAWGEMEDAYAVLRPLVAAMNARLANR